MSYPPDKLIKALANLRGKSPDTRCPICKQQFWSYEVPSGAGLLDQTPLPSSVIMSDGLTSIQALLLTCDNCGFIRQHNIKKLLSD